jgi:2-polyprenyl-6-methoxyphenol hydroxylase-like FAD-dependent oxidoreductase
LLVQHANKLGISTIWNAKHVKLASSGVSVNGESIEAELIVGADGQNSQIRRQAGLNRIVRETRRYGFRRHYRIAPWSSYMELYWGKSSQIYVTPVAPDEICVASISRHSRLRLDDSLCEVPEVREHLTNAVQLAPDMGALSVSRILKAVHRNNVVLVGDASGSVDAITGEGMCLAFNQAIALADAVERGSLQAYESVHRALMQRPRWMASLMLSLERNGGLQRRALAGLAQHPEIFKSLLAIHVGAAQFRDLWSLPLIGFGRAFLAA